jgi:hypothetical protein
MNACKIDWLDLSCTSPSNKKAPALPGTQREKNDVKECHSEFKVSSASVSIAPKQKGTPAMHCNNKLQHAMHAGSYDTYDIICL